MPTTAQQLNNPNAAIDLENRMSPSLVLPRGDHTRTRPRARAFRTQPGTRGLRNHPIDSKPYDATATFGSVRMGPAYITAGVAFDVALRPWLTLTPSLQLPLTRDPIAYGPIVGLSVRASVLRR